MKMMHLSDLHLGKRLDGYPLLEDQKFVLNQILEIAAEEQPDAALLCGDIYDKTVPSAEAVRMFDEFLSRLAQLAPVLIISGNHDSAERLAFGGRLLEKARVHVSPVYNKTVSCVELTDEYGPVRFHLLPFLKSAHVRACYPDETIETTTDAIRTALSGIDLQDGARHVLLAHQYVTGADPCESEERSIGGSDEVDASVFAGFDYVALGHLHGPQKAGGEQIRYCGTMLKYSFSEVNHHKKVIFAELGEKGSLKITERPLKPLREMKVIRGTYDELMAREYYHNTDLKDCYLHVVLTDEEDRYDAMSCLRTVYPYIMKLTYDNTRTRQQQNPLEAAVEPESSKLELFGLLYEMQNNQPMNQEQQEYLKDLIEAIWEDNA